MRVGDEGKGIRTIIQMVQLTRQDCAIASAGLMRSGLAHALHHARHRSVFQKHLADQPLMQAVLSDMALHVEASVALVMRLCRSFDRAPDDAGETAFMRLLTPAIKYWVCKSAPGFLYEAMECLGGNGYVEEGILARHYRESPVNAIWEGSGNVMCLDVLRALSREAGGGGGSFAGPCRTDQGIARRARGGGIHRPGFSPAGQRAGGAARGRKARAAVGHGGAQPGMPRHAELFAATRLAGNHAGMYGAVDLASDDINGLLARALPDVTNAMRAIASWPVHPRHAKIESRYGFSRIPQTRRAATSYPGVRPGCGSSGVPRCGVCSSSPRCSSARSRWWRGSCCGRRAV